MATMKTLGRARFHVLFAVLLFIGFVTISLWTYSGYHNLGWVTLLKGAQARDISVAHGSLIYEIRLANRREVGGWHNFNFNHGRAWPEFYWTTIYDRNFPSGYVWVWFPLFWPGMALLIPPLLWAILIVVRYRRNLLDVRRRNGICVMCGYDLRATPERCPECGATKEQMVQYDSTAVLIWHWIWRQRRLRMIGTSLEFIATAGFFLLPLICLKALIPIQRTVADIALASALIGFSMLSGVACGLLVLIFVRSLDWKTFPSLRYPQVKSEEI